MEMPGLAPGAGRAGATGDERERAVARVAAACSLGVERSFVADGSGSATLPSREVGRLALVAGAGKALAWPAAVKLGGEADGGTVEASAFEPCDPR